MPIPSITIKEIPPEEHEPTQQSPQTPSLASIVNYMSEIRALTIKETKITDDKKDQYLGLAHHLAGGIEELASDNESLVDSMHTISRSLKKNQLADKYDPIKI